MKTPRRGGKRRVRSALLLLADSGFGGERSRGWGRSEAPEWAAVDAAAGAGFRTAVDRAHWLLSLYTPAADDAVDWKRGNYARFRAAAASKAARAGANRSSRPR